MLTQTETGYLLKVWFGWTRREFPGETEEDCIRQAKAAYLEYYLGNPKEQEYARQKVVWWEMDLPDTSDATDAK